MIVVRVMGGLGNQLFLYAFARKLDSLGYDVRLDVERPYRNFEVEKIYCQRQCGLGKFRIALKGIHLKKYPKWRFIRNKTVIDKVLLYLAGKKLMPVWFLDENKMMEKDWKLLLRGDYKKKDIYLMGVFQKEFLFRDIRGVLLKELQLKYCPRLSERFENILKNENTVSVHVRRGDYLEHKKFYGICSVDYYRRAVLRVKDYVDNPYFIVFSDDPGWLEESCFLKTEKNVLYAAAGKFADYEELMLMSRCKNHIIANSSFSWWGAWLSQNDGGVKIAPRVWFAGNPRYRIVPEGWIKL